jgi:M6 family metalloprotease-like protein
LIRPRFILASVTALALAGNVLAAEPDLSDYGTVDNAIAGRPARAVSTVAARPGFLGVHVALDPAGKLIVADVAPDSPAATSGVRPGDAVQRVDRHEVKDEESFDEALSGKSVGDTVRLVLSRGGQRLDVETLLASSSRPLTADRRQGVLGIRVGTVTDPEGLKIEQVTPGSAAERANLKVGEVILGIDGVSTPIPEKFGEVMASKKADDVVTLKLLLAEKAVEMKVRLAPDVSERGDRGERGGRSFDFRGGGAWRRPTYRIGIICIEYSDAKHNPKIPAKAWEESMFSQGTYTKTSATGQPVHGSLHDYYFEQSYGNLKVEGKAFDYVEVSKKRADYATGNRTALLTEALDKVLERDGNDALKDLDGVFFLYAGDRMQVARGSLYWPHRSSVFHKGKSWPYFICPEGGRTMANISVFCHEFGHMIGLPDLYARPENPGMEGVGIWCAMANQAGGGKPQHFCAWSKERLGWIKPTVIDPAVKQKLILSPIEDSPKECFKVLARADGSEYFLLENRRKKGFDASLPGEGLLIWRVVGGRPVLQESHGVEGPSGPRSFPTAVPYPSQANDAFTPYTLPSSRSSLGGGLPVYITNIRRLADGRVTFHIGYEYQ